MFEVVLTLRTDFAEQVVARCATEQEAQAIAQQLAADLPAGALRVWVRRTREVQSRGGETP
jgi:hypothetical protein